jgi:hypothetical protein
MNKLTPVVVSMVLSTVAVADDALTLPAGKLALAAAVQSDVSKNGDSMSVAPDLAFGITDEFTVALVHTTQGGTGFWSGLGTGSLCVMGDRCTNMYSTGALLSKLELVRDGSVTLAALGGVIYNVDPFLVGAGVGAEALVPMGSAALHFKPTMYIGLNDRDGMVPNKEFVNLPLAVLVPATKKVTVGVQSGVAGPVDGFGDAYRVPVAVMGNLALGAMSAGLAFSFDRVTGGGRGDMEPGTFETRSLTLTLGYVR